MSRLIAYKQSPRATVAPRKCCWHLVLFGLNIWALLTEVNGVEATHLSGKLLRLLGSGATSNNSVL